MESILDRIQTFFVELWTDVQEFFKDLAIIVLELVLNAVAEVLTLIPVPAFADAGLQSTISAIPNSILYFMAAAGLPQCLAIISAAGVFRLSRKALTLGRW